MKRTDPYLFRYLGTTFSSRRIFENRQGANFFQIILTILACTALLAMPLALTIAKQNVSLKTYMPNWVQEAKAQKEISLTAPHRSNSFFFTPTGKAGKTYNGENQLVMLPNDRVFLKDKNGYSLTLQLPHKQSTTFQALVKSAMSSWEKQYKPLLTGGKILLTNGMLLISNVFILLLGALILFATRKTGFTTIQSFRESIQLMLNALGSASLIGMIIGFLTGDIALVLLIQSGAWMILLLLSFLQTRFNDNEASKNLKKQKKGAFTHDKATV
ncbi:Predicted integral membrane protein [Listeria grayi]|uniref:Putative component of transporter n=1 Tax=Listeria grayi FSL F6-1183 TaxID=1265827 RepID=A0A829R4T9_LISGR|nr:hypothetical protein [Listeria grayi]EUJ25814.1 putative component of transporter [Listeria grayi FSL F6-1183]VEI31476.1 Predicted integral membrane protein [Listeria grayi]